MNPISKVEPSISKFLPYQRFFVNFNIEASYLISKVVYLILKQTSILKASILKKPSISGVARFQMLLDSHDLRLKPNTQAPSLLSSWSSPT